VVSETIRSRWSFQDGCVCIRHQAVNAALSVFEKAPFMASFVDLGFSYKSTDYGSPHFTPGCQICTLQILLASVVV